MIETINRLGQSRTPFFFLIDFECRHPLILPADQLDDSIRFKIGSKEWRNDLAPIPPRPDLIPLRTNKSDYLAKFHQLQEEIRAGNSYLCNLTTATPLACSASTEAIYSWAEAPYKLWLRDRLVLFSPEPFVRIQNNRIYTYPMKGTIDASLPDAATKLLSDPKELAEHTMTVDLLRNDLSIVAKRVRVQRFRYLEKINSARGSLLQTSSEISGELPEDWQDRLGEIITHLLPAGSVSGTPKRRTTQIIAEIEGEARGYFTGVLGWYEDGFLESGVAIRYIEERPEGLFYRSGGGITADSDPDKEYDELIAKIYLPTA